jgi:hypothetical protein
MNRIFGSKVTKENQNEKKGEINQLISELDDKDLDKNQKKKREVLQKVISYVTMGIDTSKVFDKVILVFFSLI